MTDIRIRKGFSYVLDFIWDVSGCRGFLCWYKERKISREIKTLRNDGELDRVLEESRYAYLHPGAFQGDPGYHVYLRDSNRLEDIVFSCSTEHEALWWIVENHRKSA